jgi:hypothetical protein
LVRCKNNQPKNLKVESKTKKALDFGFRQGQEGKGASKGFCRKSMVWGEMHFWKNKTGRGIA